MRAEFSPHRLFTLLGAIGSLLGPEHLAVVATVIGATAALVVAARLRPGSWIGPTAKLLAVVILVNEASWWAWLAIHGVWGVDYALPLQLCDVASFVAVAALWTLRPLAVALTWFWGLAGTVNGLITPEVHTHFPDYTFIQYFVAHGGIVAAAFFLVVGLRLTPRRGDVLRVYALTVGLLVFDAAVNLVTGGNYLYLRHTPSVHSLLDTFGPWPWYVLVAAVLALVLFFLLDLPFRKGRRAAAAYSTRSPSAGSTRTPLDSR